MEKVVFEELALAWSCRWNIPVVQIMIGYSLIDFYKFTLSVQQDDAESKNR